MSGGRARRRAARHGAGRHGAGRGGTAAGVVLVLLVSTFVAVQVASLRPASAAATVPAPAGQWQFSEGSGTTTADSSGNGHTGTLGSGVTWAAPEVGAYSIALNGTAAGAVTVTVTGAVVNTSASYTVSAWVNLNALGGGNQTFVSIKGLLLGQQQHRPARQRHDHQQQRAGGRVYRRGAGRGNPDPDRRGR
jgi:hypothetical protein